jgi:sugar phosphate isomerase/epimerase
VTRRDLLFAAGALPAAAKPKKVNTKKVDITRISALSDEIARSPADAIAFAKKYGLQWLEVRGVPGGRQSYPNLTDGELKAAAQEFSDNGIRISYLDAGLYKYSLPGTEPVRRTPETPEQKARRVQRDGAAFDRRMEELKKAINAAHLLGTDKVRIFAFSRVADPIALLPRIVEIYGPMIELAAREKAYLLIENEGSCNVATCAELAAIAKLIPSKWFGLNWDCLNGGVREVAFPDGYNMLPKKRIGNVHLKGRALLAGPQRMDWAAIFRTMTKDGYKGIFGLETHIDIGGPGQVPASHESMQEILRILAQV